MKSVDESIVEPASLEWLAGLGYTSVHGDDLSPGAKHEARRRYSDVVLVPRLRDAVATLNPTITEKEVDQAVALVAGYGSQSLVDGNKEVNKAMTKGRVVLYYEQHRGVPSSCFGETEYFVKRVQIAQ